jgi:hypothetical protein
MNEYIYVNIYEKKRRKTLHENSSSIKTRKKEKNLHLDTIHDEKWRHVGNVRRHILKTACFYWLIIFLCFEVIYLFDIERKKNKIYVKQKRRPGLDM